MNEREHVGEMIWDVDGKLGLNIIFDIFTIRILQNEQFCGTLLG